MAARNFADLQGEKENRGEVSHSGWPARRVVEVPRAENGFGFTLRHFIVYPPDSSQAGMLEEEDGDSLDVALEGNGKRSRSKMNMTTPSEPMDTIFVKHVKEGGPAHHAGLRNGDRIVSVNGESVTGKTYSQVIALIQASDASLKLLVVPKDEDVLQMAYETSVYKPGPQNPYRGQANQIPEPPSLYPHGHPLTRSTPDQTFPAFTRANSRFKSELLVSPDEYGGQRMSVSSVSSNGSASAKEVQLGEAHREGETYPPAPVRTSSKNFTLSQLTAAQPPLPYAAYAGSMDSISRSSDGSSSRSKDMMDSPRTNEGQHPRSSLDITAFGSQERLLRTSGESNNRGRHRDNLRRSSDDLISGKSSSSSSSSASSTSRLPFSTRPLYQPTPYSRSKTTSLMPGGGTSVLAGSGGALNSDIMTSQCVPQSQTVTSPPNHAVLCSRDNMTAAPGAGEGEKYGLTVAFQSQKRASASEPPRSPSSHSTSSRHSVPERQMVNLVAERMKKFESTDSVDGGSGHRGAQRVGWGVRSGASTLPPKYGHESVSSRTAQFESLTGSSDSLNRDDEHVSRARDKQAKQTRPPSELQKVPATPPATVSLYLRGNDTSGSQVSLEPSPERVLGDAAIEGDRSKERQCKPAARKPSYLSAVDAPDLPPNSSNITTTTTTSTMTTTVALREPLSAEEREMKLVRRTSYLMATGRHNTPQHSQPPPLITSPPPVEQDMYPPPPSPQLPSMTASLSDAASINEEYPSLESDDGTSQRCFDGIPLTHGTTVLSHGSDKCRKGSLDLPRNLGGSHSRDSSRSPKETRARTLSVEIVTPAKTSNIKKLKAFFGERTPRILEATSAIADKKSVFDIPSPSDILIQTALNCKVAVTDGKRASDRSWKPVWAVLRAPELHLYKDKNNTSPSGREELPIAVKGCIVDIAYDYTKKKNVFRLTTTLGSEYLFQADDEDTMLQWIKAIQSLVSDKDSAPSSVSQSDLSKPVVVNEPPKTSPQVAPKSKKTSARSLRSKSPASHSPASKPRKQLTEREYTETPKTKEQNKTWKVKMAKKFKRNLSSSSASADIPEAQEVTGTFNVPLDMCPTSSYSEFVPLVVEICTTIVEAKGLTNQGIYRVPGNTGAVNMLQQELDRDGDGVDLDNEKWQDVNVVSSLLKAFFRKLPEPLVPDDLYEAVINANRIEHPEKRMLKLKKLLHDLPECNFETFRLLANHLNKVSQYGDVNKMDARNLAIVFGPTLIRPCDDSMVLMVRDMSDQCRIIESIITHSRWFFSSWDEDVNVPVDGESLQVSSMNDKLLEKAENLELGDRGRDLSAKDLMSSLFNAANKKIRKKDKSSNRSGDSVEAEVESDAPSFNERNIDREIELRRVKDSSLLSSSKETSTIHKEASSTSLNITSSSTIQPSTSSLQMSSSSIQMSSSMIQERPKYERKDSIGSQSTSAVSMSSADDTNYKVKPPTVEVKRYPAYPPSSDFYSFSKKSDDSNYHAQQHLKRLELEAKALRERDLQEQKQQEELATQKQRVEEEMARTKRELEEDSDSDMFLSHRGLLSGSTAASDAASDTKSINSTSDYSTMKSTADGYSIGVPYRNQDYSDRSLTTPTNNMSNFQRHNVVVKTPTGRRYLTTAMAPKFSSGAPIAHDDIDLCRQHKNSPSSSVKIEIQSGAPSKNVGVVSATMKPSRPGVEKVEGARDIKLQRVASIQRKGSLDSLLDNYNDGGSSDLSYTIPHPDSDSSEDLLESIAATDQRFKKLLLVDQGSKKPYQDPSLHRLDSSTGPIIGIASRFERKESSSSSQASMDPLSASSSPKVSHGSPASLRATQNTGGPPLLVRRPMKTPPKASPKTDLSRKPVLDLPSKDNSSDSAGSKSVATLYESCESFESERSRSQPHAKSVSPALRLRHDAKEKRDRRKMAWRRHTVGGVLDFKEIQEAVRSSPPRQEIAEKTQVKTSAWERLQPAVKDDSGRDLQCWLAQQQQQQQRLRHAGSSPALLDEDDESYPLSPPLPLPSHQPPPPPRPRAFTVTATVSNSHSSPTSPAVSCSERPQTFTFESAI